MCVGAYRCERCVLAWGCMRCVLCASALLSRVTHFEVNLRNHIRLWFQLSAQRFSKSMSKHAAAFQQGQSLNMSDARASKHHYLKSTLACDHEVGSEPVLCRFVPGDAEFEDKFEIVADFVHVRIGDASRCFTGRHVLSVRWWPQR